MKLTINATLALDLFKAHGREDYFSFKGMESLLDYYDSVDDSIEFDVIGICGECTEYGNDVLSDFDSLISDYGYLFDRNQWMIDNDISGSNWQDNKQCYIDYLISRLEQRTTVLHIDNGNYIVFYY